MVDAVGVGEVTDQAGDTREGDAACLTLERIFLKFKDFFIYGTFIIAHLKDLKPRTTNWMHKIRKNGKILSELRLILG